MCMLTRRKKLARASLGRSKHLRLNFGGHRALGPGKIRLLELIQETGSISAAARALRMPFKRAWCLVNELNGMFRNIVVASQAGGPRGGGAALTETGLLVIRLYRDFEQRADAPSATPVRALGLLLEAPSRQR
jgi:molybdate transport system regulatory protein